MPSIRISKQEKDALYFITCTVQNWYYLFDRHNRFHILEESLQYCQKNKEVKVYAYVFMLNHIHLIVSSPDTSRFLCDFKKYTSRELMKNILATEPNVASLFPEQNGKHKIWQETNFPKLIETEDFFLQKKQYIEENPIRKEYVSNPKHWIYSSANPFSPIALEAVE
ncbi:MAG: transposase [Candidatus Peregrinibacteria bacterium]